MSEDTVYANLDHDVGFISAIFNTSPFIVKKVFRKVSPQMVNGIEREIYKFILHYYKESLGSIPSRLAIKQKFPEFKFIKETDALTFYADELKNRVEYKVMTEAITEIQNNLFIKDLEEAKHKLRTLGIELSNLRTVEDLNAKKDFNERIQVYNKAKEMGGMVGLPTGVPALDDKLGGLLDEMLIVMGRSGVGKTWSSILLLCNLWKYVEGSIVYITNEISPTKILMRTDAFVAQVPYSKYRKGQLSDEDFNKILKLESGKYENRHDLLVINGAGKSVAELEYDILSYEPALVMVDGLYLQAQGYDDPFRDTLSASREYQKMHQRHGFPLIGTTQMTDDEAPKYSRALREDADVICKLTRTPALESDKLMCLEFPKVREEESGFKDYMHWDFDDWNFEHYDMDVAHEQYEVEYE